MPESSTPDPNLDHLDFLISSFTDNGKSLRGFVNNPQELSICILTAGLLTKPLRNLPLSVKDEIKKSK